MSAVAQTKSQIGNLSIYRCPDCGCDTLGGNKLNPLITKLGKENITWKDEKVSFTVGSSVYSRIGPTSDTRYIVFSDDSVTVFPLNEPSSARILHETKMCRKKFTEEVYTERDSKVGF